MAHGHEGEPGADPTRYAQRELEELEAVCAQRDALLEALKKLVRRSDNGDTIEPGWYEIEEAREVIEAAS